jgi:hypothetical protein
MMHRSLASDFPFAIASFKSKEDVRMTDNYFFHLGNHPLAC